ncbi:hypothetical protein FNW02_26470 [Komarekiella sp. 'clone 1']|uniref:Uncharacterized protein n=1 Tax=Komarekiella delphini-convector SJRDD-AB1 TaxID=2593771 RepID=A0AA40VTK0_9NOST|nr:hypothetical protein [Komarekiella delphini-convector]MBD6619275.1 hypothetical protein [Komarekiella delphini-convector SJRDD-AB1]
MASRQKAKQSFSKFINIRQCFNYLKRYLITLFVVGTSALKRLLRTISKQQSLFFVLLLLLFLTIVTFAAILPGTHTFEGNIISQKMSFIYNGQQPKRFIENIRSIKELENEGIQTLTFTGNFQSESLPQLNQLNSLKIKLKERESKWIIAPANPDGTSEIDLNELRLQPNTKVAGINYDFYRNQLAFSLQPNPKLNLKTNPNILKLYLGEQPIKVIVEGYELPDLNLQNHSDDQTPLEFILNPNNKELNLELPQNTNIYITLAKLFKYESEQWFRGKIETKNVQFIDVDRNGSDLRDDLDVSTIVEGKIRMIGQEQEIKQNQFLMGGNPDAPLDIKLIRHLQIVPKKGIEARFSGITKQIQIGLDQDFPVSRIQGSWLDSVLPRDAIIALFSFGAATVANLLSWLFSNASKSASKP